MGKVKIEKEAKEYEERRERFREKIKSIDWEKEIENLPTRQLRRLAKRINTKRGVSGLISQIFNTNQFIELYE